MASAEEAAFETERKHILQEIVQGLKEASLQLKTLNRNMEHTVEVGKGFERSAMLWEGFVNDMAQVRTSKITRE